MYNYIYFNPDTLILGENIRTVLFNIQSRNLATQLLKIKTSFSGTAIKNVDFRAPDTLFIEPGLNSKSFSFVSKLDSIVEGEERSVLQLQAGEGYNISGNSSIVFKIMDTIVIDSSTLDKINPQIFITKNNLANFNRISFQLSPSEVVQLVDTSKISAINGTKLAFYRNDTTKIWYIDIQPLKDGSIGVRCDSGAFRDMSGNLNRRSEYTTCNFSQNPKVQFEQRYSNKPYINFSLQNICRVDSIKIKIGMDSSNWMPFKGRDSIKLAGQTQGLKIYSFSYKSAEPMDNGSLWMIDSVIYDTEMPKLVSTIKGSFTPNTWNDSILIQLSDNLALQDSASFALVRLSDRFQWVNSSTGTASWISSAETMPKKILVQNGQAFMALNKQALETGIYRLYIGASDKANNSSKGPLDSSDFSYINEGGIRLVEKFAKDTVIQNDSANFRFVVQSFEPKSSLLIDSVKIPNVFKLSQIDSIKEFPYRVWKTITISGRPTQEHIGKQMLSFQTKGNNNSIFNLVQNIYISDVNDPPAFIRRKIDTVVIQNEPLTIGMASKDPNPTDILTLRTVNAPTFIKILGSGANSTLLISPKFSDSGFAKFNIIVTDGKREDTSVISLKVQFKNTPPIFVNSVTDSTSKLEQVFYEDKSDSFIVSIKDPNPLDSIRLISDSLPKWLQATTFKDSIFQFIFKVNPKQSDVGESSYSLRFVDNYGGLATRLVHCKINPVNDEPIAQIGAIVKAGGAVRIPLDVVDEDGSLSSTEFTYKLIRDGKDTVMSGKNLTGILDLFPLGDGKYDLAVKAKDSAGLMQFNFVMNSFTLTGIQTISLPESLWVMTGVLPTGVSANNFSGSDIFHWNEEATPDKLYNRYSPIKDSLKRGLGTWMFLPKPVQYVQKAEFQTTPWTIKLSNKGTGWNQIANPFPYPVEWTGPSGLREWDPQKRDMKVLSGSMLPGAAYWIQVPSDTNVIVPNKPAFPNARAKISANTLFKAGTRGNSEWTLKLSLKAGKFEDAENYIGVSSLSKVGFKNLQEAPRMGSYINLSFTGKGGEISSTDIRDNGEEEIWFPFTVQQNSISEQRATLAIEGIESIESQGLYVYLIQGKEAKVLSKQSGENISTTALPLSTDGSKYSLVISSDIDFTTRLQLGFTMTQNVPNPIRDNTTFRFTLPYQEDIRGNLIRGNHLVNLSVYNLSGRKVSSVLDRELKAGKHRITWNATSRTGSKLPKGQYIARLQSGNLRLSKTLVIE